MPLRAHAHDTLTRLTPDHPPPADQAIEDLRIKYQRKAAAEAAAAASKVAEEKALEKPREADWAIDDDDELEQLRKVSGGGGWGGVLGA